MEVIKFKKISKSKYKLYLKEKEIELFESVIIKYNLLSKKDIDLKLLKEIIEYNSFFKIYNVALNYISIKMRNKKELITYLKYKNFDINIINKVITRLEKEKHLNEEKYIEAFINDKINFTNYGPYKIKRELLKYDIDEIKIDNYLDKIEDEIWNNKINNIIEKKVKLNNKLSKTYFIQKITIDLYYLGFDKNMINEHFDLINFDESKVIKKEYDKAIKKFNNKYEGDLLKKHIRNYLIKKGFTYESIDNILLY